MLDGAGELGLGAVRVAGHVVLKTELVPVLKREPVFVRNEAGKMESMGVTDEQLGCLARQIGEHMAAHIPACQVFSGDEITWIRSCFNIAKRTKSVALATAVGFIVLGIFSVIGFGVIYKLRELTGR